MSNWNEFYDISIYYIYFQKKHVKLEHTSPVKNDMKLSSNPLHWSVKEVVNFIKGTECAPIARLFVEQVNK